MLLLMNLPNSTNNSCSPDHDAGDSHQPLWLINHLEPQTGSAIAYLLALVANAAPLSGSSMAARSKNS